MARNAAKYVKPGLTKPLPMTLNVYKALFSRLELASRPRRPFDQHHHPSKRSFKRVGVKAVAVSPPIDFRVVLRGSKAATRLKSAHVTGFDVRR